VLLSRSAGIWFGLMQESEVGPVLRDSYLRSEAELTVAAARRRCRPTARVRGCTSHSLHVHSLEVVHQPGGRVGRSRRTAHAPGRARPRRITTPEQQRVGGSDCGGPHLLFDAGEGGELQHSDRRPPQLGRRRRDLSPDEASCHLRPCRERVDRRGTTSALDFEIGWPRRSTRASWVLALLMPARGQQELHVAHCDRHPDHERAIWLTLPAIVDVRPCGHDRSVTPERRPAGGSAIRRSGRTGGRGGHAAV
jgi:hypothetical protein